MQPRSCSAACRFRAGGAPNLRATGEPWPPPSRLAAAEPPTFCISREVASMNVCDGGPAGLSSALRRHHWAHCTRSQSADTVEGPARRAAWASSSSTSGRSSSRSQSASGPSPHATHHRLPGVRRASHPDAMHLRACHADGGRDRTAGNSSPPSHAGQHGSESRPVGCTGMFG